MERHSHAIGIGIGAINTVFDMDIALETVENGKLNALGELLESLVASGRQLHFTPHLIEFASRLGGTANMRTVTQAMLQNEDIFEYLAANLGLEALYRAEYGADRLERLLTMLPVAEPPQLAKTFLSDAAECFLLHLDNQCIVMCRGAVEVLVESLDPQLSGEVLGKVIPLLVPEKISQRQADDMSEINRQAREILHLTPHSRPPSAEDCLLRLCRLLAQLYPA